MKKLLLVFCVLILSVSGVFAGGSPQPASANDWPQGPVTVITPWAVGGVADIVNRKTSTYGAEVLGQPILATNELGAGGNVALTNFLKNGPNSTNLIFGGEGAFSIAPNVDGSEALQFTYGDYEPIINLYSSIFVMTADASLGITDLESLRTYGQGKRLKVAVNGIAGSEAFLAKALFGELGLELDLISYNGANLALDAAAKGETSFAISHQSQAAGSVSAGTLTPVVVFDETGVNNDIFKNVKGVGEYGYAAYFRNRCFILARKGTDPAVIDKVRNAYLQILAKPDIVEFYSTLMIEVDPLTPSDMDRHVELVTDIVLGNL
ncbi:MAG: tripartite tricarboxylate transporter substrate binding protein [Spirochaetales bacterium]|nr:tripartite tricarboxylate transporter substrate binding protein [Spirochaetales bacterium]